MPSILVLESDPTIRVVAASLLDRRGYVSYTARNANDAFMVAHRVTLDVVFTELLLDRELEGLAFVRQLDREGWRGQAIFTSHDSEAIADLSDLSGGESPRRRLLRKPYGGWALLHAVAHAAAS